MGRVQTKYLTIKKFGWKRVAKNHERFGWYLDEAIKHTITTEETEYEGRVYDDRITITPHTKITKKTRMELSFHRDTNDIANMGQIFFIELLFNIVFLLRRIIGFILPWMLVPFALVFLMGESGSELGTTMTSILGVAFLAWLGGIILEVIISKIGEKVLKYN